MTSSEAKNATDNDIVKAIQQGGQANLFEPLYNRYYTKVLDKCYSLVKKRELAEELAEDIFSKTFEKIDSFKCLSSFSSWLYSITYNHCIDYLRENKKLHYPSWNREHELPEIIDENDEPLESINYENLVIILDKIHPEEKALLLMKYQDNLSLKQIGQALRVSEDAAKMRLKRARARVVYLYKKQFKI